MIELILGDRCIDCDRCVKVCPTNVFDAVPGGHPVIARQLDCQTCFMCELYCRRDSGWGKNRAEHPNETWYMKEMLREVLARNTPQKEIPADGTPPAGTRDPS